MKPAAIESKPGDLVERIGSRLSNWLDRFWTPFLLCATGATILTFSGYAHTKNPWMDEVLFLTLVRLRSLGEVWGSLMAGIQTDPPIVHTAMYFLFRAVGEHLYLARLPAILGFGLMCFSFACLVRRHAGPLYAAAAFFLPYATMLRPRAMDARPYGLMMGFSALALLCWDAIDDGDSRRRRAWRIGFTVSLAAAFSTHFYSILLLAPLMIGELSVWIHRRRPRWITPLCVAAALIPYAAWLPILIAGRRIYGIHLHGAPKLDNLQQFFARGLENVPFAGVLILLAAVLAMTREGGLRLPPSAPSWRQRALFASCFGFLILPGIGYVAGVTVTKFFITNYFMVSVFGVILGLPLALASISGQSRIVGLCLLLPMAGHAAMVTARGISGFIRHDADYPAMAEIQRLIPESHQEIVVESQANYLPLYERNRFDPAANSLVFLFDRDKAVAEIGTDTPDVLYMQLRQYTPARIEAFDPYISAHRRFYMLTAKSGRDIDNWQYRYFQKRLGARIAWVGEPGPFVLYRLDLDSPEGRNGGNADNAAHVN